MTTKPAPPTQAQDWIELTEEDHKGGWKISPKTLQTIKKRMREYPDTDWEIIEDVLLAAAPPSIGR